VSAPLEFCAVVGLDGPDPEREPPAHIVEEADGCALIAGVEDLQHPNARAVIDRGELTEGLPALQARERLHVHLHAMIKLRLFISLPALLVRDASNCWGAG